MDEEEGEEGAKMSFKGREGKKRTVNLRKGLQWSQVGRPPVLQEGK